MRRLPAVWPFWLCFGMMFTVSAFYAVFTALGTFGIYFGGIFSIVYFGLGFVYLATIRERYRLRALLRQHEEVGSGDWWRREEESMMERERRWNERRGDDGRG